MKWAGLIIFVGFLSLGASMILQLLVALNVTYIKGIYFLSTDLADGRQIRFGIWNNCIKSATSSSYECSPHGLGYPSQQFSQIVSDHFVTNMAYALVISPIAAGFTGLAAGGAFLHLCTNTILWPLLAAWAMILTAATLGVDLAFFILGRNSLNETGAMALGSAADSSMLGPAIWMQVAALPPAFFGFIMLALGFYLKKKSKKEIRDDYYDFEPSNQRGHSQVYESQEHHGNGNDEMYMQQMEGEGRTEASENSRTDLRPESRTTRYSVRGAY